MLLRTFTLWFFFAVTGTRIFAQLNFEYTAGKFLIKGKVIDVQSKKRIASTNLLITNRGKGLTCDADGNFMLYVYKQDTLKFSSVGYMSKTVHVAELDSVNYYALEIQLIQEFIKLKEITIYPYHDLDEFKQAFIDAKEQGKVNIYGLAPPKYSHNLPKSKFYNPISFLYDRIKKRAAADPDFKP